MPGRLPGIRPTALCADGIGVRFSRICRVAVSSLCEVLMYQRILVAVDESKTGRRRPAVADDCIILDFARTLQKRRAHACVLAHRSPPQ